MTSQSRAIRSQYRKIAKFLKCMALIFWNRASTCGSTDLPVAIYDRKIAARRFDSIHDILRFLSLAQSLLKGLSAPIWHIGNRGVNIFPFKRDLFWIYSELIFLSLLNMARRTSIISRYFRNTSQLLLHQIALLT